VPGLLGNLHLASFRIRRLLGEEPSRVRNPSRVAGAGQAGDDAIPDQLLAILYHQIALKGKLLTVSVSHLGQMVANCPPMIEITGWYHEVR